jgi:uncharacterized membrane protein
MHAYDFTRLLWVLSVALFIVRASDDLTLIKSPRALNRIKFRNMAIVLVVVGVLISLVSAFSIDVKEFTALKGTGLDIVMLGITCSAQYIYSTREKTNKFDDWAYKNIWWVCVLLGLIVGIVGIYFPFQLGNSVI